MTTEPKHSEVALWVSKAWDGELAEEQLQLLRRHLATCDRCAETARSFRRFLGALDSAQGAVPTRDAEEPG